MNLDDAKFIGNNNAITGVWYIGTAREFPEFCNYINVKFPSLVALRVNAPIDDIPISITSKLEYLDCSNTNVTRLTHIKKLKQLRAANTTLSCYVICNLTTDIEYLKIGPIGTRITLDSHAEYLEYKEFINHN